MAAMLMMLIYNLCDSRRAQARMGQILGSLHNVRPEIGRELLECADMLSEADVKMQKIAEQLHIFEK